MSNANEVEIKFRIDDLRAFPERLRALGFHEQTPRTHELNTLYDLPGRPLAARGDLLRLRQYGDEWVLTHKSRTQDGRHKIRRELETRVADGEKMEAILLALGYTPSFRYEKFRCEWSDGTGHVVLDETPIGNFGEIEGPPEWIDRVAEKLGIPEERYIKDSYAALFFEWKARMGSKAEAMTFNDIGVRPLT